MADLSITFHPDVPAERRAQILEELRGDEGVEQAEPLFPGSDDVALSRLAYARLRDDSDAGQAIERLKHRPEVQAAEVPATRGLPTPPAPDHGGPG